jgi:hypothetical protein
MRVSLLHTTLFFVLFILAFFKPVTSLGQEFEAAAPDSIRTRNAEEMLYSPEDERSFDRTSVPVRDSVLLRSSHHPIHQRVKAAPESSGKIEKNKEQKEESIMSFNFFYYMIKKFKLSDMVDDE